MEKQKAFGTNKMYPYPNFLIVGAAKAGTTSLAKYLGQHDNICIPERKELRFFAAETLLKVSKKDPLFKFIFKHRSEFDESNYFSLFDNNIKLNGEASPHYLYHYQQVIPKIKNYLGDIPIVIIIRNPVERAISNWKYNSLDFYSFDQALEKEEERKNKSFNSFWFYKELGLYSHQIQAYMNNFSNVKVIIFEEFIKNIEIEFKKLLEFLGANSNKFGQIDLKKKYNESYKYIPKSKFMRKILSHKYLGINYLRLGLHKNIKWNIKIDKMHVREDLKESLYEYYEKDIQKLELLLNKELTIWKKY